MSRVNGPDEEQFVLRLPPDVAERVRAVLRESPTARPEDNDLQLRFMGDPRFNDRRGEFVIGGNAFPVDVQDLPCVVESFKTYDATNMVKSNDIGQILLVRHPGDPSPEATELPEGRVEMKDGLTAPLRNVRQRFFGKDTVEQPENLQAVEKALAVILSGGQPRQTDLHIAVEEEWVSETEDEEEEDDGEDLEEMAEMELTPQPAVPPPGRSNADQLADELLSPNLFDAELEMQLTQEFGNFLGS